LIAFSTPKIGGGNAAAILDVNGFTDANGAAIEDTGCHSCHISITPGYEVPNGAGVEPRASEAVEQACLHSR
jgi:hypothetical protein